MGKSKVSAVAFFGLVLAAFLLVPAATFAHTDESEVAEGKELVEKGVSCDELTDGQLEAVGEYLMGLMHPEELHELMHERMGIEEDTPYHEKFHVNLAQSMYCGEAPMAGMMGMMGWWNNDVPKYAWGRQMMGAAGAGMAGNAGYASAYSALARALYIILLVGLIALVYFWLLRIWKGTRKGKGKGK